MLFILIFISYGLCIWSAGVIGAFSYSYPNNIRRKLLDKRSVYIQSLVYNQPNCSGEVFYSSGEYVGTSAVCHTRSEMNFPDMFNSGTVLCGIDSSGSSTLTYTLYVSDDCSGGGTPYKQTFTTCASNRYTSSYRQCIESDAPWDDGDDGVTTFAYTDNSCSCPEHGVEAYKKKHSTVCVQTDDSKSRKYTNCGVNSISYYDYNDATCSGTRAVRSPVKFASCSNITAVEMFDIVDDDHDDDEFSFGWYQSLRTNANMSFTSYCAFDASCRDTSTISSSSSLIDKPFMRFISCICTIVVLLCYTLI